MRPRVSNPGRSAGRHRVEVRWACVCLTAVLAAVLSAPAAASRPPDEATPAGGELRLPAGDDLFGIRGDIDGEILRGHRSVGEETLWIFDADFEDLLGDNAGWTSLDMSGTLEIVNYWHKDTIRIDGFEWLGDSTWWCGTYNDCWIQPRGYGNNWLCCLSRELPEIAAVSDPGDSLVLSFDQRFAMENDYDYGYVDVLPDGGPEWTTICVVNNVGFAGHPGNGYDWDDLDGPMDQRGHVVLDISDYAGVSLELRFRFESDLAYSSQDQYDNPPHHSVLDGAWQLDNIKVDAYTPDSILVFLDDCESPGSNGWSHDNVPASGQTGVVFERVFQPDNLRDDFCYCPGWWMAALDSETGAMVDGQNSWLMSPPIDISGTDFLVGQWDAWVDLGGSYSNDFYDLYLSTGPDLPCVMEHSSFVDALTTWPDMGAYVTREAHDWDLWAWGDWLVINWRLWNADHPEPGWPHMTGFMLDRQRVGIPVGGPPTRWDYYVWRRFHDTFDVAEALTDTAWVQISDWDGIASARLIVSSDAGATWQSSPMIREHPEGDYWLAPPPVGHIAPSTEILYYFESTDGVGNVRTHPRHAPDAYYEFSILPIRGSVAEPAILLVDKHGRTVPGLDGSHRHMSEYYFREALDILGFEYDVYDVEVPSGSTGQSNGPDSAGYKYYDTQIWFTDEFSAYTIKRFDQVNLISWLSQAGEGKERNLLLTGNDIGEELVGYGTDTLDFYSEWLASEYLIGDVAGIYDTLLILQDAAGGFDFMTHDDMRCPLRLLEWGYG